MALKKFNPITPGRRGLVLVDRSGLWKGDPVKGLTEGLNKKGAEGQKEHTGVPLGNAVDGGPQQSHLRGNAQRPEQRIGVIVRVAQVQALLLEKDLCLQ